MLNSCCRLLNLKDSTLNCSIGRDLRYSMKREKPIIKENLESAQNAVHTVNHEWKSVTENELKPFSMSRIHENFHAIDVRISLCIE